MPKRKDPCQKAACAIQQCLQLNNYKEHCCQQEIEAMRICCSKLLPRGSVCCSGFRDPPVTEDKGSSPVDHRKAASIKS
ncbi:cx9C motif-containing protein 4 [Ranitomeya variabilis]|uniref:cx9C motif-containing protein 4 n=1 Tax=Ranitomeya variabilis TaxID=490064 RepID=UPI004055C974